MKCVLSILFSLLTLLKGAAQDQPRVIQTIRYCQPHAEEVLFVWGTNGWNEPGPDLMTPATATHEKIAYSKMNRVQGCFEISLSVPAGTVIDFVFQIVRDGSGNPCDLWDKNVSPLKDYHILASQNSVTEIRGEDFGVAVEEKRSVLSWSSWLVCAGIIAFFPLLIWHRRLPPLQKSIRRLMLCFTAALMLFSILIRAEIARRHVDHAFGVLAFAVNDLIFLAVFFALFYAAVVFIRKKKRVAALIAAGYIFICCLLLLFFTFNIRIVEMLGKPLNYQWLYYSDFLKSIDARAAMRENVSARYLAQVGYLLAAYAIFSAVLYRLSAFLKFKIIRKPAALAGMMVLAGVYVFSAKKFLKEENIPGGELANPVFAFMESLNPFAPPSSLFTAAVPDSLRFSRGGRFATSLPSVQVKNVLVFVMESVPAEYLGAYGGKYGASPVIDSLLGHALVFENVYAHAPATNFSMVSLLCSVYPWISYNSLTEEHPDIALPSLSSELSRYGYTTGFFNSADNNFQSAGKFLKYRGFGHISDCNSGPAKQFDADDAHWKHMGGRSDSATAAEMCEWIGKQKGSWFTMFWSYQTHYPYFLTCAEEPLSGEPVLNRYLNALKNTDRVLGSVMRSLREQRQLDSTLIVIVGDHGEAFGRHNQITHARKIYEENLHVPCILFHPSFAARRYSGIGGLSDIAPTVLALLQRSVPPAWHGRSLFTRSLSDRVFFFAPWSDHLFGFREANRKFIYNASTNSYEVYDLLKDPEERLNLADQCDVSRAAHRLAGWVQFAGRSIDSAIAATPVGRNKP